MDYKARYKESVEKNRELEEKIKGLSSKAGSKENSSNEMMMRVFHSTSLLIALSKLDTGEFIDVNSTFLEVLGYKKEEIIGKTPDDIELFADIEESNKYIKLLSRLQKIKDFVITLRTKNGEKKPFLFSESRIQLENEVFLITVYSPISTKKNIMIRESQGPVLEEIFNTVSSYLALFSVGDDERFYIIDVNRKVEEVEFIDRNEICGKCVDDTSLAGNE